jgi:hypothetical protein
MVKCLILGCNFGRSLRDLNKKLERQKSRLQGKGDLEFERSF